MTFPHFRNPRPARRALLAVALVLLPAVRLLPAAEPTSAELLESLQTALTQEAAANAAAETGGRPGNASSLTQAFMGFRQVREALARGNDREAVQSIEGYIVGTSRSPAVQKACSDLLARMQQEHLARETAAVTEIDEAVTRAGEDAIKAKTARDMDPVLVSLGRLRDQRDLGGSPSPAFQRALNRLQAASGTLRSWQDYLAALDAKRPAAARNALSSLSSNNDSNVPLLPRSELLARMQALPDPYARTEPTPTPSPTPLPPGVPLRDLLDRLKTVDDIPPVLREMAQHEEQYRRENSFAASFLPGELDRLARAHALFKAGMPFNLDLIERSNSNAGAYSATIASLRAAFVRLALPRALGLPESTVIPAEENVAAFLRRTLDEAKTAGNWPLVARVLDANRRLSDASGPSNMTTFNGETRGLEGFLAGRNQEEASQWSLAVVSYQTALKSGSVDLPTREIGERLERIAREHPAEFRLGVEQFLNPPERPDGPPFFNRRGGYPGPYGPFPGGFPPGAAGPTPVPTLPVPAVTPPPTPVKPSPSPAPSP